MAAGAGDDGHALTGEGPHTVLQEVLRPGSVFCSCSTVHASKYQPYPHTWASHQGRTVFRNDVVSSSVQAPVQAPGAKIGFLAAAGSSQDQGEALAGSLF